MSAAKKDQELESEAGVKLDEGENSPEQAAEKGDGSIKIAEEVIAQIATQALLKVSGVQPASPGLVANLRLGKKTSGGVRIAIEEEVIPAVVVEAYITTKYGLRIPDIAWDVQESIKKTLEQYTGYNVKAVNVYVQGVYFEEEQSKEASKGTRTVKDKKPAVED